MTKLGVVLGILFLALLFGITSVEGQPIMIRCPDGVVIALPIGNELSVSCATYTPTPTPTPTPTSTPTSTATSTSTPTRTSTPTFTPVPTATSTPTPTSTPTNTVTPTNTPTATATATMTPVATNTPVLEVSFVIESLVSCLSAPSSTDAFQVVWQNPTSGPKVNLIQIGQGTFTNSWRRSSGLTTITTAPVPPQFTLYNGSTNTGVPFIVEPDTTYMVRLWNGVWTASQNIMIPSCATSTPTPTPNPLAQRHPDAGIWVAYRGANTVADLQQPHIKGVMIWLSWDNIWTGNNVYNWGSLRSEYDLIVDQAGKKTFIEVSSGYCPNNPWPAPVLAVIAQSKIIGNHGCKNIQFYDPVYLTLYKQYIKALADEIARLDSTDGSPNVTDVVYLRAAEMAADMENLPNESDLGDWQVADFNPAPNGNIYNANLTVALMNSYYQAVLQAYDLEFTRAYQEVGLTPPAHPAGASGSSWWQASDSKTWMDENEIWHDVHNTDPNPNGAYYDQYLATQARINRATGESGGNWGGAAEWLGMYNYWELLANLHNGLEFSSVYGTSKAHPTLQPKGPISYLPNREAIEFVNHYVGEMRNPATAPGVWIAFRGYYFEDNWSSVFMKRWVGNYEYGIVQSNLADSAALYGLSYTEQAGLVNPVVERNSASPDWALDLVDCLEKYNVRECEPARQNPTLALGLLGSVYRFTYPVSDLGIVRWCGTNMFCIGGTATRTETMLWARATKNVPILLDVDDAFSASLNDPVTVRVVYLDQGSGSWELIADGVERLHVNKAGSNLWKEIEVTVPAGALDLALDPLGDGNDIFHMVEIKRAQ